MEGGERKGGQEEEKGGGMEGTREGGGGRKKKRRPYTLSVWRFSITSFISPAAGECHVTLM